MFFRRSLVFASSLAMVTSSLGYDLVRDYSGQNFFDGWDFYGYWDNLTLSAFPYFLRKIFSLTSFALRSSMVGE